MSMMPIAAVQYCHSCERCPDVVYCSLRATGNAWFTVHGCVPVDDKLQALTICTAEHPHYRKAGGGEGVSDKRQRLTKQQIASDLLDALTENGRLMQQLQQAQAEHPSLPYLIDSQQQTCKVCGRPDKFDFHVPDEIWQAIVPEEYRGKIVCLYCFDEFAAAEGIEYKTHLSELCFAGKAANLMLVDKAELTAVQAGFTRACDKVNQLEHDVDKAEAERDELKRQVDNIADVLDDAGPSKEDAPINRVMFLLAERQDMAALIRMQEGSIETRTTERDAARAQVAVMREALIDRAYERVCPAHFTNLNCEEQGHPVCAEGLQADRLMEIASSADADAYALWQVMQRVCEAAQHYLDDHGALSCYCLTDKLAGTKLQQALAELKARGV